MVRTSPNLSRMGGYPGICEAAGRSGWEPIKVHDTEDGRWRKAENPHLAFFLDSCHRRPSSTFPGLIFHNKQDGLSVVQHHRHNGSPRRIEEVRTIQSRLSFDYTDNVIQVKQDLQGSQQYEMDEERQLFWSKDHAFPGVGARSISRCGRRRSSRNLYRRERLLYSSHA